MRAYHLLVVMAAACFVMGSQAPAQAQVDPIFEQPTQSNPVRRAVDANRDLFEQLIQVRNPPQIGLALTSLLRSNNIVCSEVTDFQVIYRLGGQQRVKLKCPGRKHYGLIINQGGSAQIFGGDGMVGEFSPGDGIVFGVKDNTRTLSITNQTETGNLPGLLQGGDATKIPGWLVTLIVVNAFIIGAFMLSFFWFMRAKKKTGKRSRRGPEFLSSAEKDAMVIQSKEVLPDIYQHPEGMFIARGQRGKRRLFGNLFFAILYRDYGWKLREITSG